jgi:predicted transposase YdaD
LKAIATDKTLKLIASFNQNAVREILKIADEVQQHEAMAAIYVLAGLRFEETVIAEVITRDVMRESVTYQAILREGREEGREEEAIALITRQLRRRLRQELPEEVRSRLALFSLPVLEDFSEALLDFTSLADLEWWLATQK